MSKKILTPLLLAAALVPAGHAQAEDPPPPPVEAAPAAGTPLPPPDTSVLGDPPPPPVTTSLDVDDREARMKAAQARRARRHDGSFFHAWSGAGYAVAKTKIFGGTATLSGPDTGVGLAVGGALADNVIAYISGEIHRTLGGDFTYAGQTNELMRFTSLTTYLVGGGVTYYFMPINLYVGGEAFMSVLHIANEDNKESRKTSGGLGGTLKIGKEWWASPNWGLGVSLRYLLTSVEDAGFLENPQARWDLSIATLAFSATFN